MTNVDASETRVDSRLRGRAVGWRLAALLLVSASGCLHIGERQDVDMVLIDRLRIEAMMAADPAGLDLVLHDDLTYAHSNGTVETKAELIESLVSGRVSYLSVAPENPRARVHEDSAIVVSPVEMKVVADGETYELTNLYTAVYWFEDGRWQLAAYQSSRRVAP